MPYVQVMFGDKLMSKLHPHSQGLLHLRLCQELRPIISRVMSAPEPVPLTPDEITVETTSSKGSFHLLCTEKDVQILIFINWYAEREAMKDQLAAQILRETMPLLPDGTTAWVWILLQNGGFAST